jgi:hypothetical protein
MTFTEAERDALRLADGRTLAEVTSAGGVLHGFALSTPDLAEVYSIPSANEATPEERRDAARQALFQIAVYCLDRNLAVESNVSKRWSRLPADARPPIREIPDIVRMAEVYRDRCLQDLNEERLGTGTGRPKICTTDAAIHEMSEAALAVVAVKNDPPRFFARSASLVRVAKDEAGQPRVEEMSEAALSGELDRMIYWYRALKDGEERQAQPPREVVKDILSLPASEWNLPSLRGLTGSPAFHPDGSIHNTPGYDEQSYLYFAPTPGFEMPMVPEPPTRADVEAALALIEEAFVDFPFCGPADRANAYGALLTAVLRPGINGPVPLYVTDKPQAGAGAGLLQRVIGVIAEGREPNLKTMPAGAEMRKEILATLKRGTAIQIFDNIETKLSSPELASALTAAEVSGRILGLTDERTYPARTFWLANGNNIVIGGDLARRSFKTRIDPQTAFPWQRENFRHPDLIAWSLENRGRILAAVFTLARAWIQAGRPEPQQVPVVGSFEAWRDVIGGILEFAGAEEFLGNADETYLEADADRVQWEGFLECLWEIYGCEPFPVSRVAKLLLDEAPGSGGLLDSLPDDLGEAIATRRKTFSRILGRAFGTINGRHFPGGWCLKQGNLSRGIRQWVITYSKPDDEGKSGVLPSRVVDDGVLGDTGDAATESEKDESALLDSSGGVGGVSPPYPEAKEEICTIYDNIVLKYPYRETGRGTIHHIHRAPTTDNVAASNSDSNAKEGVGGNTPSSTPNTPLLDPPPPGCLKHPIERYERRKYDHSIRCMVPGCRRPAAYGCGAGFPLCEGHYLAERQRVLWKEAGP